MERHEELALQELEIVRHKESQLQAQKEALLLLRKEHEADIEERQRTISEARKKLPDTHTKKMFDDVFGLVDSCYHQELLILELKEQLTLAQALREGKDCSILLKGLMDSDDISNDVDPSSILRSWYHQMKKYAQSRSNQPECTVEEECFYNVRLSTVDRGIKEGPSLVPRLSFSTRHRGYCLYLSVEQSRSSIQSPSKPLYAITSDINLDGLEAKGQEYLEKGYSAEDFIMQVVWPIMDDQMCI